MRVARAAGVLAVFSGAGVLALADVHVARRLGELAREVDEDVLLATALAVRAVRLGSTCLDLARLRDVTVEREVELDEAQDDAAVLDALPWPEPAAVEAALRRSPLVVGAPGAPLRPLRLVDTDAGPLLYLVRYWRQESSVREVLDDRARTSPPVDRERLARDLHRLFDGSPAPDRQRLAVAVAATRWTSVLAGGPGTGKTTTVARVLAVLFRPGMRIALAAPTGKAAARLQESVREQADELGLPSDLEAMTLHRLLGWRPGALRRSSASDRLPYDLVVVDETSMVSLTMMARLLEAVRPDARLLLVGDPDQLTSVDAGAVLADLVARPTRPRPDPVLAELVGADLTAQDDPGEARLTSTEHDRLSNGVVRLSRGRRFGGAIAELAVAVRDGRADRALELLRSGAPEVSFLEHEDVDAVREDVVRCGLEVTAAARRGKAGQALALLERHRVLCAHRQGRSGVSTWDRRALGWVAEALGEPLDPTSWYAGQPLLVTRNDHDAQVYNGDTGVVVDRGADGLVAAFARGRRPVLVPRGRLADVVTVHAMTIHRSQGSQYDTVSVVLPATASSLLTRELLYTAVTRARLHVRVLGTEESVRAGIERQVLRASGLRRVVLA